jgi:hypothetical protein
MKYFALLGALLLVAACGSSDHGTFINDPSPGAGAGGRQGQAGSAGRAGSSPVSDAGAAGAPEADDLLAPIVEITAPKDVADPNSEGVLTTPQVTVVCSAKASKESGANKVLGSSVKIQMFGADDKQIGMDGSVHATDVTDEYNAIFTLTDVPSAAVHFVCSASDDGVSPRTSSTRLDTFVDHGPEVTLKNPAPSSAHALSPAILFKFTVLPVPLSTRDKQAEVTTVSLKVNGVDIDDIAAHEIPASPGEYQISINLSDPAIFAPPPAGSVPVRIVATNKRGTVRTSDTSFNVDSLGPVIQIVSPATPNSFVGGKVTLTFTVTDAPAGVDPAKVQVELNGTPFFYDPKNGWATPSANNFSFTFDTIQFVAQVQLAVNIRATDLAGNPSDGASILYYLDNVAPIIDMMPPTVQEVQYLSPASSLCSAPFQPLGDSPRDLAVIVPLIRPRALLWDVGNSAEGQDAFYFSDIDNSNTNTVPHLYFQPDTSKPLLKHGDPTKHGAFCDTIADETLKFVTLVPLPTTGSAYFPATAAKHDGICGAGSETPGTTGSQPLCNGGSDLNRVIQHEGPQNPPVPVVYVIAPDALQCTGTQFQITNFAPNDGWVCAAVSAIDKTGNRSVSAPLRLCLDSAANPETPPCAISSVNPPSCVSDCVPPPHFNPELGLVFKPH